MTSSTDPTPLPSLMVRHGVVGGLLLGLTHALDQVLYYLNGYLLFGILVGLLACTASATRQRYPKMQAGPLVLVCWGTYALAVTLQAFFRWVVGRGVNPTSAPEKVRALLLLLLLGGVLSGLVVLVVRVVKPAPK